MRSQWIRGVVLGLLCSVVGACGSSGPSTAQGKDASPLPQDAAVQPSDTGAAAGCDEEVLGESYCIINSPGGGGTPVNRQPVDYNTCKL